MSTSGPARAPGGAVRAVLFDFFGTLTTAIRRGPAHDGIARRLGCDPEEMATALDRTFRERASGAYGGPAETMRRLAYDLAARPTEEQVRRAVADRVEAIRVDTRLRPEAVPVLRAVRARGLRTGLISDCVYELPAFLPGLPVAPLLDTCVYSVELGACKPHPALYLAACRRLGVQPAQCVFVGDGGSRELSGARAVGMTAVRLAAPDLGAHLRYDVEVGWCGTTIGSLAALPDLLDRITPDRDDLALAG